VADEPYGVLGLRKGASMDEVRKAYRKLAKQHHPDRNPGNAAAEERFKRISAAFTFLDDDQRRARYDRGEIDADGNPRFAGFGGGGPGGGARGPFGGGDPFGPGGPFGAGGPFAGMGGFGGAGARPGGAGAGGARGPGSGPGTGPEGMSPEFEEFFGDLFGQAMGGAPRGGFAGAGAGGTGGRGADVRAPLEVSFVEALRGAKKRVSVGGATVEVSVPAGVETGRTLKLAGKGKAGPAGPGDLLLAVKVLGHPVFRRDGDDVRMDLPVSLLEALEGARVPVETPTGTVSLSVPPGSNSGSVLRLKGRGVDRPGAPGDLYVRLVITLPDGDQGELRQLLAGWPRRDEAPRR
jgi:DnaJ-class molecular chaperone